MKSTQIHQDSVGDLKVSTVFIEGGTEPNTYRYFETAFAKIGKAKHARFIKEYDVYESGVKTREEADAFHAKAIEIAEKVLAYNER